MTIILALLALVIPGALIAMLENEKGKALNDYCRLECKEHLVFHAMNRYDG